MTRLAAGELTSPGSGVSIVVKDLPAFSESERREV